MKTIGMIGGLGPESTIEYYREMIAVHRQQIQDGSYPSIIINSIDLQRMIDLMGANELGKVTNYLADAVQALARAGAEIGLVSANTPHIVFDDVMSRSPIPLVSIVRAACDEAVRLGMQKLALFGTRYTMQGRFYQDTFSRHGITLVVPDEREQTYLHDKYMNELVIGIFRAETRECLLKIVARLRDTARIDGVILGGTELPLILSADSAAVPLLDTTKIHVRALYSIMGQGR